MKTIQWGILGTWTIAREFAQGLTFLQGARLLAVASRMESNANTFAKQFKVPRAYTSYDDLVKDKDVDVVYVATPNHVHRDNCILCLEAGKAVLCEKPFTLNAKQAREVVELAQSRKIFCMEAMWMRFIPLMRELKRIIDDGAIGDIKLLTAEFGELVTFDPHSRFFNPDLGGGAMLDLGVYPISLAYQLMGKPAGITSQVITGSSGVDEQSVIVFQYADGRQAVLFSSFLSNFSQECSIAGTRGRIRVHTPIYRPFKLSITQFEQAAHALTGEDNWKNCIKQHPLIQNLKNKISNYILPVIRPTAKKIVKQFTGNGYNYEAEEVMDCLRNGQLESKIMPLRETVEIMELMDAIRDEWRLKFPGD